MVEQRWKPKSLGANGNHERANFLCAGGKLRARDELSAAMIDNSSRVIYLKDRAGRYLLVNRQYERSFRLRSEQIIGKTDRDIFPRDIADVFSANDRAVLDAGAPLEFEESVALEDGLHVYLSNKFPLRDAAGAVYGVCGISADITERKRSEEFATLERKRAETWLDRLIETTQDAVVTIDPRGAIVVFNPSAERIFGYARAEVEGKNVSLLMAEPYASEHQNYLARYNRTGERRAIGRLRTVAGRRKNGEVFPVELSVTEVTTKDDIRYAAFLRDVSEKSRLQNQLIESERLAAVGATAAKLAHEIGNPLNGMAVTAQLIERRLKKLGATADEATGAALGRLMDEILRLSGLVREFSSLSRRQKYDFRPVSLAAAAAEVLELESANYRDLGIRVERRFAEDLPLVSADAEKLKQAILNLVKNAVEAMPRGGALTLRARRSDDRALLEVTDTGLGIPEGVDIFEPFATTKPSGTGLGLVIVRQIVSAHGGTVSYASERGRGTVFTVSLPIHAARP